MTQNRRHPRPSRPANAPKRSKKRRSRTPVVRILPIMILVALSVLGFRVTVVVKDMQSIIASVDVGQSVAFAQEQAEVAPAGEADAEPAVEDGEVANAEDDVEIMPSAGAQPELALTDQTFTRSELELLQRLSERRQEIESRAKDLDAREAMLRAAETRIDGKIAELQELEKALSDLVAEVDEQEQQQVMQMVNIYGAMKPKDAARIFNDLDMPILLTIVESMRENKVAPILAEMDAMKATSVTEALSTRTKLPGLAGEPQG